MRVLPPAAPWWTIVLPIASNTDCTAATASLSPPIMIESAAFFAPTSPPDTGASREWTPFAFAAS